MLVLGVYATFGAIVALVPRPIDEGLTPWLRGVLSFLRRHGLAGWIDYDLVEYASHAVLFAPLAILAVVAFGRRMAWLAVILLLGACALVEAAPSWWMVDHDPSSADLALNVIGAIAGAVVGFWAATPTDSAMRRSRVPTR